MPGKGHYVPALGFLTPLYDPLVALTTREGAFKRLLIAQAGVRDGERVLDLACGTGALAWPPPACPSAPPQWSRARRSGTRACSSTSAAAASTSGTDCAEFDGGQIERRPAVDHSSHVHAYAERCRADGAGRGGRAQK